MEWRDFRKSVIVNSPLARAQRLPELFKRDATRFTGIKPEAWETW
jgi:hypothetical protein